MTRSKSAEEERDRLQKEADRLAAKNMAKRKAKKPASPPGKWGGSRRRTPSNKGKKRRKRKNFTQDADDGDLHLGMRMHGSNATGMVSDESESKSDDDDDDVPAAPPVRAALGLVPAKANAKKDVLDAWFLSSKEEVQVVDNAAPATKEVEVDEDSEKLDECT